MSKTNISMYTYTQLGIVIFVITNRYNTILYALTIRRKNIPIGEYILTYYIALSRSLLFRFVFFLSV